MHLRRFAWLALLAASAVLAFGAATASSGTTTKPSLGAGSTPVAKVGVRYTVKKFVRHGHRLFAYGTAIGRYIPAAGGGKTTTSRKAFTASVAIRGRRLAAAQTICPVLELTIQQLDLNLLGALVHLDRVHLLITADSNGGLLGDLLCKLSKQGKLTANTNQMTWALKKSGLATSGTGFVASVQPSASGSGNSSTPKAITPLTICPVLDLTLGPVDLNLLGLLVHLDQVHLTINADSEGGLLGSLLCSLAGTPPPTP
jgi:hypothetical protein